MQQQLTNTTGLAHPFPSAQHTPLSRQAHPQQDGLISIGHQLSL